MHPRGKLNSRHICCSCTLAVEVSRKEVIKPLASRPRLQQWRATRQKTACPIPFGSITHPSSCHSTYKTNTSTTTSMEEILCCVRQLYSIQSSNYWVLPTWLPFPARRKLQSGRGRRGRERRPAGVQVQPCRGRNERPLATEWMHAGFLYMFIV
jgi:hypothetical protein